MKNKSLKVHKCLEKICGIPPIINHERNKKMQRIKSKCAKPQATETQVIFTCFSQIWVTSTKPKSDFTINKGLTNGLTIDSRISQTHLSVSNKYNTKEEETSSMLLEIRAQRSPPWPKIGRKYFHFRTKPLNRRAPPWPMNHTHTLMHSRTFPLFKVLWLFFFPPPETLTERVSFAKIFEAVLFCPYSKKKNCVFYFFV